MFRKSDSEVIRDISSRLANLEAEIKKVRKDIKRTGDLINLPKK